MRKLFSIFAICLCSLSLGLFLSGCNEETNTQPVNEPVYQISIDETENGSITTNKTEARENDTILLYTTPNNGYVVDKISISNVSLEKVADNIYVFNMPKNNISIGATFKLKEEETYNVNAISTGNGEIVINNDTYYEGDEVTIVISPNNNYELDILYSNEVELNYVSNNTYSFIMPANDVTIFATFKESKVNYYLNTAHNERASISLSKYTAQENELIYVTISPDINYKVTKISANIPVEFTMVNKNFYTFNMPAHNITITVEVELEKIYSIEDIVGTYKTVSAIDNNGDENIYKTYFNNTFLKVNSNYTATLATHYGFSTPTENNTYSNYYIFKDFNFTMDDNYISTYLPEIGIINDIEILNENTIYLHLGSYYYTFSRITPFEIDYGTYISTTNSNDAIIINQDLVCYDNMLYSDVNIFENYLILSSDYTNDKAILNIEEENNNIKVNGYKYIYNTNEIISLKEKTYSKQTGLYNIQNIAGFYTTYKTYNTDGTECNLTNEDINRFFTINENSTLTLATVMGLNYSTINDINISISNNIITIDLPEIADYSTLYMSVVNENLIKVCVFNESSSVVIEFIKTSYTPIQNGTYTSSLGNIVVTDDSISFNDTPMLNYTIIGDKIIVPVNDESGDIYISHYIQTETSLTIIPYQFHKTDNSITKIEDGEMTYQKQI